MLLNYNYFTNLLITNPLKIIIISLVLIYSKKKITYFLYKCLFFFIKNFASIRDLLLLFPENDEETVNQFLKLINLKENDYITFNYFNIDIENKNDIYFPFIINAKEFVKKWLNINGSPNRFFCYIASLFTEELIYKEKLELFARKSSVLIF